MSDVLDKLYASSRGLCTENPADYMARGISVADALEAADEIERLRGIEKEAHFLLTWTHQDCINVDVMPERGWRVEDLHPGVWNRLNSAERELWRALTAEGEKR